METEAVQTAPDTTENRLDLLKLTFPILVETTLFMLLGFVDVFMLGRFDDLAASGVNTANQAITLISVVFLVFSSACGILVAQYLGANEKENASRAAALALVLNLVSGVIVSLLVFAFSGAILGFIGAEGQVFDFAQQYLTMVGSILFLQSTLNAMSVIIRSHGMTKETMMVAVGANIVNIVMDVLLIPGMGAVGAALATVICRVISAVVVGAILFIKVEKPSMFRLLRPWPAKELRLFFRMGFPSAAEAFLYHMSQMIITALVLHFLSENELIAKTYMSNITFLFYLFSCSVGQAAQIIVGHMVGAGDYDGARKLGFRAWRLAMATAVITSLLAVVFREQVFSVFTSNADAIAIGGTLLIINFFLELGRSTNLTVIPCLRAAGDVKFPTLWAVFSNWAIGLGGAQLLAVVCGLGINGLWVAMAADEVFRAIIMLFRWRGSRWENKNVA